MEYTTIFLMACACVFALVNSLPIQQQDSGLLSHQALNHLVMVEDISVLNNRGRRTVGVLRGFFPDLTKMIDKIVNQIVAEVLKALGPTVLKGFLGGGALGGGRDGTRNSDGGSTVTVAPPFDDDDDDDDDDGKTDDDEADKVATLRARRDLRQELRSSLQQEGSENNEVLRTTLLEENHHDESASELTPLSDDDNNDDDDDDDDESRNKRLATSGLGGAGGSGNFIFDIIKNVLGASTSSGSGASTTVKTDEEEPVPGPATRFLVIANRGISNLIQDLILRIAATSERFVNFKARLITSII